MAAEKENTGPGFYHLPVLLTEAVDALQIKHDGIYVDCTFGGGGHSKAILKQLGPKGRLLAFDQDIDAQKNLPAAEDRLTFVPHNFKHLSRFLKLHQAVPVQGILADLGVSSHQFDEGSRGFSTRFDGPLDMRMDVGAPLTAAQVLNTKSAAELQKIFEVYGNVTNAKTLGLTISEQRKLQPFNTIQDFKQRMYGMAKGNPNKYFAQVFQALRIEVNQEVEVLKEMLMQAKDVLAPGGRLAVISFHSLEDRLVKNFFKNGSFDTKEDPENVFGVKPDSGFTIITKKPITAGAEELKKNTRSRSATLRVAQKN